MKKILIIGLLSFSVALSRGEIKPNALFADNMVLQQGVPVPVWGVAAEGQKVTVECAGQSVSTTAKDGKWMVRLKPLKTAGPLSLVIKGDLQPITLTNVPVGEVWVCSGQSNMERQLGPRSGQEPIENWEQEAASADLPQIRMFFVPRSSAAKPSDNLRGSWVVCSPQTAADFSAVGFFFARALQQDLKVPIGMIFTSVGGTAVELWTSREALEGVPAGAELLRKSEQDIHDYPQALAKFKAEEPELMKKYQQDVAAAAADGSRTPKKPAAPPNPSNRQPSCLFNGMVAPLIPYAFRGVIWYQGESNGGRGKQYRTLFPLMIKDWRSRWQQGDFPFCFVQLATYRSCDPMVREAQLLTLARVPNTAMAVTTDVGDTNDIHPTRKRPVGERLALAARALAYGEKIEFSGPLFESMKVKDGKATLRFSHAKGLTAKGGGLTGFVIAGADKKLVPAEAVIQGETVVVSSPNVPAPEAVRYNWVSVAEGNLYNAAGLPASPFRTDIEPD